MDLVYPPVCFVCERPLESGALCICTSCTSALTRVHEREGALVVASQRLMHEGGLSGFIAPWCLERRGPMHLLIHQLKSCGMTRIGDELGREVGDSLLRAGLSAVDGIVPVPLHASRRRERGYNQSEFIARGVGSAIGRAVWGRVICRLRNTTSQAALSIQERHQSMRDLFRVPPSARTRVEGKNLLLVDDFVSSGATMSACARALKRAGTRTIVGCAIAVVPERLPGGGFLDIRRCS